MKAEGLLLLLTLGLGLLAATTKLTDSAEGKVIVSALLIASTGVSFWLKRKELDRDHFLHRTVARMADSSTPSQEVIEHVQRELTRAFQQFPFSVKKTTSIIRTQYDVFVVVMCSNDHKTLRDQVESLFGALVFSTSDLRVLSRMDERDISSAIDQMVGNPSKRSSKPLPLLDIDVVEDVRKTGDGLLNYWELNIDSFSTHMRQHSEPMFQHVIFEAEAIDEDAPPIPPFKFFGDELVELAGRTPLDRGRKSRGNFMHGLMLKAFL